MRWLLVIFYHDRVCSIRFNDKRAAEEIIATLDKHDHSYQLVRD